MISGRGKWKRMKISHTVSELSTQRFQEEARERINKDKRYGN